MVNVCKWLCSVLPRRIMRPRSGAPHVKWVAKWVASRPAAFGVFKSFRRRTAIEPSVFAFLLKASGDTYKFEFDVAKILYSSPWSIAWMSQLPLAPAVLVTDVGRRHMRLPQSRFGLNVIRKSLWVVPSYYITKIHTQTTRSQALISFFLLSDDGPVFTVI